MELNYFELFGIQVKFWPDTGALRQSYLKRQKSFHPDLQQQGNSDTTDFEAESALYNKAYTVLSNFDSRLKYILQLSGSIIDDEKNTLPQSFLMEMMDLNDIILEAPNSKEARATAEQELGGYEKRLQSELEVLTLLYDEVNDPDKLVPIKDLYFRKRYLNRLRSNLLDN